MLVIAASEWIYFPQHTQIPPTVPTPKRNTARTPRWLICREGLRKRRHQKLRAMNNVLKSIFVPVAHVKRRGKKHKTTQKKKKKEIHNWTEKSKSVENESCSVLLCFDIKQKKMIRNTKLSWAVARSSARACAPVTVDPGDETREVFDLRRWPAVGLCLGTVADVFAECCFKYEVCYF